MIYVGLVVIFLILVGALMMVRRGRRSAEFAAGGPR